MAPSCCCPAGRVDVGPCQPAHCARTATLQSVLGRRRPGSPSELEQSRRHLVPHGCVGRCPRGFLDARIQRKCKDFELVYDTKAGGERTGNAHWLTPGVRGSARRAPCADVGCEGACRVRARKPSATPPPEETRGGRLRVKEPFAIVGTDNGGSRMQRVGEANRVGLCHDGRQIARLFPRERAAFAASVQFSTVY